MTVLVLVRVSDNSDDNDDDDDDDDDDDHHYHHHHHMNNCCLHHGHCSYSVRLMLSYLLDLVGKLVI